jgi:hypothetical protein
MKKVLISLAALAALCVGSEAWARVVVRAGPVRVAVGRPVVRPAYVPRPVYVAPRPVVVPAPLPVVTSSTAVTPAPIAPATAEAIRARRLRNAIHQEVEQAVQEALGSQNQQ